MTIESLKHNAAKHPIVLLRLDSDEYESLQDTKNGITKFTLAKQHSVLQGIKTPCLTLIFAECENGNFNSFIAAVTSRAAITTLDMRITIKSVGMIDVKSEASLSDSIHSNQLRGIFDRKRESESAIVLLSPKLSIQILDTLSASDTNTRSMHAIASLLNWNTPKIGNIRFQSDAIKSALNIFGLNTDAIAEALTLKEEKETTLTGVRIREDAVIEHDARFIPGFTITDSFVTGRAYFTNKGDQLEVITANKRPLEEVLGVDLIYINRTLLNVVLVQS